MDIALWKRTHSFTTQPLTQKGFYFIFYFFYIFYFNEGKEGLEILIGVSQEKTRARERERERENSILENFCRKFCVMQRVFPRGGGEIFIGIQEGHVAFILLSTNCNTSCHLQKILHSYFPIFAFIYLFILYILLIPPLFIALDIVSYIYIMLYYYVLLSLIT